MTVALSNAGVDRNGRPVVALGANGSCVRLSVVRRVLRARVDLSPTEAEHVGFRLIEEARNARIRAKREEV